MNLIYKFLSLMITLLIITSCTQLPALAPPENTPQPSNTAKIPTNTPEPTLGQLEYIDAVYCWVSHIDEGEYNLIRFFPSGNLIDVFVQGYESCHEAWVATGSYLTEDKIMNFSHGQYQLSHEWITFTLSAINSNEVVGNVKGQYSPERMLLSRQGSEEREYLAINKE